MNESHSHEIHSPERSTAQNYNFEEDSNFFHQPMESVSYLGKYQQYSSSVGSWDGLNQNLSKSEAKQKYSKIEMSLDSRNIFFNADSFIKSQNYNLDENIHESESSITWLDQKNEAVKRVENQEETHQNIVPIVKTQENKLQSNARKDEYPVVWFDPKINSQEHIRKNSSISLFSDIKDFMEFVQPFDTSFLLIVSKDMTEGKLLANFEFLKDTFVQRLLNFEEEELLKKYLQETSSETLQKFIAYLIYNTQNIFNETSETVEDILTMCNPKEIAKQFQEEFIIFWFDSQPNLEDQKLIHKELDIEEKNIYSDFEKLLERIDDNNILPYHLILSGESQAKLRIQKIKNLDNLLCLYIYDKSAELSAKKFGRLRVQENITKLLPEIKEGIRTISKCQQFLPIFANDFDDWDKSHIQKIHNYLQGFTNFEDRRQAKEDFIDLAKKAYNSVRISRFEKEYFEYDRKQILQWYTEESPIYKLVNNSLRLSTSDSIPYCRLIIKDLKRAIQEVYQEEIQRFSGVVYRGAYISEDEFQKLRNNIGKEIEIPSFLSTTTNREYAESFLSTDTEKKILIKIIVLSFPVPEMDEKGFVDMKRFSSYQNEEEVLFNVQSRFQVLEATTLNTRLEQMSINFEEILGYTEEEIMELKKLPVEMFEAGKPSLMTNIECKHLVLLYGAQMLRKYMTMKKPSINLKFNLPQERKCNHCSSQDNLFAFSQAEEIICKECLAQISIPANAFLLPINKNNEDFEQKFINIKLRGIMLELNQPIKFENCGYRCHNCQSWGKKIYYKWINCESSQGIIECAECFQINQEIKYGYLFLSENTPYTFWEREQDEQEKVFDDFKMKEIERHGNLRIGDMFNKVHEYRKCKEYCKNRLKQIIRKKKSEIKKIDLYENLAKSSSRLGEYHSALECYTKALKIRKYFQGENHPDTATSYNNLALAYSSLGDNQKALDYFKKAYHVRKLIFGKEYPDAVVSFNNLAFAYSSLGDKPKVEKFLAKTLDSVKLTAEIDYQTKANSYNNLALTYENIEQNEKAIEFNEKALQIRKLIFGECHPDTAASYNNLAILYEEAKQNEKSIEFQKKALEIREFLHGESHPDTADAYHNLALTYQSLKQNEKAIELNTKALSIREAILGEKHPDTVASYNNLASLFRGLEQYQEAVHYQMKALSAQQGNYSFAGTSYKDSASSNKNQNTIDFLVQPLLIDKYHKDHNPYITEKLADLKKSVDPAEPSDILNVQSSEKEKTLDSIFYFMDESSSRILKISAIKEEKQSLDSNFS